MNILQIDIKDINIPEDYLKNLIEQKKFGTIEMDTYMFNNISEFHITSQEDYNFYMFLRSLHPNYQYIMIKKSEEDAELIKEDK